MARQAYELAEQAWKAAGRTGKPRFVAGMYWGLGPNAAERAGEYIRNYYTFLGPMAERMAGSVPATPEAVKGAIQAFADIGVDELVCWPCKVRRQTGRVSEPSANQLFVEAVNIVSGDFPDESARQAQKDVQVPAIVSDGCFRISQHALLLFP